ncbi:MAG: tetratricopeptide repeat protein [Alphaproteobacteria bacterium]|nr:tetratricopeptide repeat protein [Alphaproteobacteria bacterium]
MNLEAAISWCRAGDDPRTSHHLEVAETFRQPGLEDAFREARREMRAIRQERTVAEQRKKEEEQARLMSADPLGLTGGPSWRDPTLPADFLDAHDDEAAARLALVVEGYDASLRASVGDLGAPFARALLDFEDGRADLALQALLALPDDVPVVRFERARAAYALGDPAAAGRELRTFAKLLGRHANMGRHHTGSFLALCLTEAGDPAEGLRVMRSVRADAPDEGGPLFAQLLEMNGALDEAEKVLLGLARAYPKDTGVHMLLARVQLAKGDRVKAMTVLERSLQACACAPGSCGARPPDLNVVRTLATLYLEDRKETDRGLELAQQAGALIQAPTWDDAYLQALAADRGGHPDARRMAEGLWEHTPPGSPAQERLERFLPA